MDSEIKQLQQEYDNCIFLTEGLKYDHQASVRFEILNKAENIKLRIKELKQEIK
jgi:hypothetical protein